MEKYRNFLKSMVVPALALLIYLCLIWLYQFLDLPSQKEIIAGAEKYYQIYGYYVVLIGALAEGALFINWYLPGSVVVALGMVLAKNSGLNLFLLLALVIVGFFSTALLNYALGRFGWYHVFLKLGLEKPLQKFKSKVEDKGLKILFTTYVHPNFGALSATAAGILRMNFGKFALYSLVSIALWNTFWTGVFYWVGDKLIDHLSLLIVGAGILIYAIFSKELKKPEEHINIP